MAVPPPSHACWRLLASGQLSRLQTDHLGTQLFAKRLERSPEPVAAKAATIHAYFSKWERILTRELEQISKL